MQKHILSSVPDEFGATRWEKAIVRMNQPLPAVLEGSTEEHLFLRLLL